MKKFLFFYTFFLLMGSTLQAQWTNNFTITDLEGNSHTLYDYLIAGKTVLVQTLSTNDPYGYNWDYLQQGILDSIYQEYGPDGTDEIVVLLVEIDAETEDDCLLGLPTCSQSDNPGDWTAEVSYPVVGGEDGASLSEVFFFDPYLLEAITYVIQPDLNTWEEWYIEYEMLEYYIMDVPVGPIEGDNVKIYNLQNPNTLFCGEMTPVYQVQNWGTNDLTSFEVELRVNDVLEQSFTWTGNLGIYEATEVVLDPIVEYGPIELKFTVSSPNGNSDADIKHAVAAVAAPYNTPANDLDLIITNFWTEGGAIAQILDANGEIVYEEFIEGDDTGNGSFILDFNDVDLLTNGCHELLIYADDGYGIVDGEILVTNEGAVILNDWIFDGFSMTFYNQFDYDFGAVAIAFLDENENGVFDDDEIPLSNQSFSMFDNENDATNELSFTNEEGFSTFILEENTDYVLTWQSEPLWNSFGESSVSFSTTGSASEQTFYFPLTPTANFVVHDLDLSSAITRCSQSVNYWLTYSNTGTVTTDGYVELISDELTTFLTASPAPDSTAGDTLYWFYEGLLPSNSEQIILQFEMPGIEEFGVEVIGESIDFEANIDTWEGAGSAKSLLASELVCAYDPNDKLVYPSGYGGDDKNYTLFEDSLEYTVRFQNTGNDTAFTVLITDELDINLDINTLRVIASSHELVTNIDMETRIASFLFEDIYLADSFVNEPASHGFVKYRILANDGLSEATQINNTANIFFDFNPAIVTNTIASTMVSTLPTLPVISASPQELDFGFIPVGEVGTKTLIVQNPGDLDLVVTQVVSESPAFSPLASDFIVPGGGEVLINVDFTPTEDIAYTGNLVLRSNVGDLPIAVKGQGGTGSGINDLDLRLSIAPNPSSGIFDLNWTGENALERATLKVFSVNGQTILSQLTNGNQMRIDLSGQAKGVYYLSIETESSTIVQKLIVQ